MRALRTRATVVAALGVSAALTAIAISGCGSASPQPVTKPTPKASSFPLPNGRTLRQISTEAAPSALVASPAGLLFDAGINRYAFGVFTKAKKQVSDAQVALYFARGEKGKAIGPYPAGPLSLVTPPAYRAQTTASDPGAATVVYVAPQVNFSSAGEWRVMALFRTPDGLKGTLMPSASVGRFPEIPDPGDRAPRVHTATAEDVGGDLAKIDTRVPSDQMHKVDLADVEGKKPVVLLFATPQFCESRTCGPVVDIAEQVRQETSEEGTDVAFIHQEVYNDNDPRKGIQRPLRAFHLETEPWLFVLDQEGRVSARIEGAFSALELKAAVQKAAETTASESAGG